MSIELVLAFILIPAVLGGVGWWRSRRQEKPNAERTDIMERLDALATHLERLDSGSGEAALLRRAMGIIDPDFWWKKERREDALDTNAAYGRTHTEDL